MEYKEKLKFRKIPRASPEEYFYHHLFMHYLFKNETKLKASNFSTYSEKYMNPIVHDLVIANQRFLKPFVEFFDYSGNW